MKKDILFGPFAPDTGAMPVSQDSVSLIQALNVRMSGSGGYVLTDGPAAVASTPVDVAIGTLYITDGLSFNHTSTALYSSADHGETAWNDVTPSGMATASTWEFARYGDDLIAVSPENAPIARDLTGSISADWADLADSPPTGSRIGIIREHIVIGDLTGESNAVQWNSIGVADDWPTPESAEALAEEAGKQYLPVELGAVMAIVGMEEFGLVFQEYGITRMTYVGGNVVYQFDTFDSHRGHLSDNNTVKVGNLVYFHLRSYGFCVTDGYSVKKIDAGYEEAGSFGVIDSVYDVDRCYAGAYASRNSLIMWRVDGSSDGDFRYVYYNIGNGTFSHWDGDGSIFDQLSGPTISFPVSARGISAPADVPRIMVLGDVSGTAGIYEWRTQESEFSITTGWIELTPGQYSTISRVTPLAHNFSDDPTVAVKIASDYQDLSLAITGFSTGTAPSRGLGHTFIPSTSMGRFHCIQISGAVTFDKLIGVRVEYQPAGDL